MAVTNITQFAMVPMDMIGIVSGNALIVWCITSNWGDRQSETQISISDICDASKLPRARVLQGIEELKKTNRLIVKQLNGVWDFTHNFTVRS